MMYAELSNPSQTLQRYITLEQNNREVLRAGSELRYLKLIQEVAIKHGLQAFDMENATDRLLWSLAKS